MNDKSFTPGSYPYLYLSFSLLQYMSAIFYHDGEQKRLAEETMKEEQKNHGKPIATTIAPMKEFYIAEE